MLYYFIKRLLDIIVSLLTILILIPIFIPIIIILKFSAEGEVFYVQERVGYKNSKFKIFKFATMLKNSLNMGMGSITLTDDFRVTKFGKTLRKTKINELPQLFNILIGDISLVGPRPILESDWNLYSENIKLKIYDVKPGLTGIGSIMFRDEEAIMSSVENMDLHIYYEKFIAPYKGELEMWYQEHRSLYLDFQLILITVWVVIFPETTLHEKLFKNLPKRKF